MAPKKDEWIGKTCQGQRGRYLVKAVLGAGGMATVYLGEDEQGREVAIKIPKEQILREEGFAKRFLREIGSLIKLAHRNVLRVIDIGDVNGIPFAVLQYLALGSLRLQQPLDISDGRVWPMGPDEIAGWLDSIAEALDYVAAQGYVHRDVKPENIMFDADGNAYLGDFGVIKARADVHRDKPETVATGAGLVLGTPHYMAPEVLLGEPYDGRADQYSLAVTVYELLAARLPFPGEATLAIVGHTTRQPPAMSQFVQNLPPAIERVVQKGLAKNPADRYPSCRAFAKAFVAAIPPPQPMMLEVYEEATPSKAGPPPAPRRSPPPVPTRTPGAVPITKSKTIICPYCEQRTTVPENVRSKTIRCAHCKKVYYLEAPGNLPTRQELQALRDTKQEDRRRKQLTEAKPVKKGPSFGEIVKSIFRWTLTTVVVLGMLVGAYFGYFAFLDYQAKKACDESARHCDQGNYEKARESADKAIKANSDYAMGYVRSGRAKYFLLDHEGALADFKKAIELDDQLGLAYAYRSIVLFEGDYLLDAADDADRAVRLLKDSGIAHAYRGMILASRLGKAAEALSEANRGVTLDNKSPHVLLARAHVLDAQAKVDEAKNDLRTATMLQFVGAYPHAAGALFRLQHARPREVTPQGSITRTNPVGSDLAPAMSDANTALTTDANSVLGHLALAECYYHSLEYAKARAELTQVHRLSAGKATRGYEFGAYLDLSENNIPAAIKTLSQGIEQLPNSARLLALRGELHNSQGDREAALADLSKALTHNPRNPRYYEIRARLYRDRNSAGDAVLWNADEQKARDLRNALR